MHLIETNQMRSISALNHTIIFSKNSYTYLNEVLQPTLYSKVLIIVDQNTSRFCLPYFLAQLATEISIEIIELEAGEHSKNIETCIQVWQSLLDLETDRKSIILNLGGGVITDLGGFVACTFKRGIEFINIPTTLLAMVDAAIGGKNGVDLGTLKNQIGIIREPKAVLIDTSFLKTLSAEEMRSGLAEMLKHGLIYDIDYWNQFKNLSDLNLDNLKDLIHQSIQIKINIVSEDLSENGIRKALNFGHTLGHAIESFCMKNNDKPKLLHGHAVAIGMVLESFISREKGLLSKEAYYEIKYIIGKYFEKINFSKNDIENIISLLIFDKKNEFGQIQFALLNGIGGVKINENSSNELIHKAFYDYQLA